MSSRFLIAAALLALVLVALAWLVSSRRAPMDLDEGPAQRAPFLPELRERIRTDAASVDGIELRRGDRAVALARTPQGWVLPDKADYPADPERVEAILRGLIGLEMDQALTTDPKRFAELGLAWPDERGDATLVRILAKGQPVSEVVVGRTKFTPPSVYVRRAGANETWRCLGEFAAEADAARLMQPVVAEIPAGALAAIEWDKVVLKRDAAGAWVAEVVEEATGQGAPSTAFSEERKTSLARLLPELFTRLEIDDVRSAGTTSAEWTVSAQVGDRTVAVEILPSDAAPAESNGAPASAPAGRWVRVAVGDPQPGLASVAPTPETVQLLERVGQRVAGREFRMPAWRAGRLVELLAERSDEPAPSPAGE